VRDVTDVTDLTDLREGNLLNSTCQNKKRPILERALFVNQKLILAVDGRSNHCYRGDFTGGQVEGEVAIELHSQ